MKRTHAIHFGAGALGRGLVIPVLTDSGCNVSIVDMDDELIDYVAQHKGYKMYIANEEEGKQFRDVPVIAAYSLNRDIPEIKEALAHTDTVTTSVRRENLPNVAKFLAEAWQTESDIPRLVICCENIEDVSEEFSGLLLGNAQNAEHKKILEKVIIPNTVVDRGCSPKYGDRMTVQTEKYFEIGVDKNAIEDTGIELIPAKEDIQKEFYRKRFLINTLADVLSFFAIEMKFDSFAEAMQSKELFAKIGPYMELVKESLVLGFGISREELNEWNAFYQKRFSGGSNNSKTKEEDGKARGLATIARSIWDKLAYKERFAYPVIMAYSKGYDVEPGIKLLAEMVAIELRNSGMSTEDGLKRLQGMWCLDDPGCYVFNQVKEQLIMS